MSKVIRRGVSIYIDGTQVKNSVRDIRSDMRKLINEQNNMVIGADNYIAHGKKIGSLAKILREHKDIQKEISGEYGKMSKSSNKFFNSFQVFMGNMMTKGLSFLASSLGDAVNKIRTFEKANVVLAGILGTTRDTIKDLTASAISLGKTSKYTASQVTELQTELAKLGFEKREIKDSQKHILNFATALEANLGDAAALAGASLRAFDADTKETERFVSAMTMAANKSALGFESLATAMPIVSPIAKAFNFSLEDTLALLGNLSDSGFDASSSATALRNILLYLADSNGKLAKELGKPVRNLDDLVAGFKDLEEKGIDLAKALELTDKRSVAAFQTFMQGADKLIPLRDSLIDVGDELERVANDQMDNLDGAILSLGSSWEALMLSFSNSSGVMKTLVDWTSKLVQGLNNIVDKTKLLQDRSYYNEFLDEDYQHAKEVQSNVIAKRKSEGYSPEDAYDLQTQRSSSDLESKMMELEAAKKKFDDWNNSKDWKHYLNPANAATDKEIERAYEVAQYEVDRIKMQLQAIEDLKAAEFKVTEDTDTGKPKGNGTGDKIAIQRQKVQDSLRVLEEQHLKDMTTLKQKYLNDDAITEDMHNQNVLKQQDKYDEARKAKLQELLKSLTDPSLRIDIAKQVAEIDAKALDRQISDRDKKKKESLKKEQDLIKWNEEETKKIVTAALQFVELEEDKAYVKQMDLRSQGKISEEEYQRELTNIQIKHLEERLRINGLTESQIAAIRKQTLQEEVNAINRAEDQRKSLFGNDIGAGLIDKMKSIDEALLSGAVTFGEAIMLRMEAYLGATDAIVQKIGGDLSGAMTNFASAEESAVSRKYDKQIAAAEGNSRKQKKLEEQKQKELNAIKAKYADKQFAVATAMTISSTAVAAMEAYKAMAGIPIVGPALGAIAAGAAIAYGASQIAVAKEQRNAAKEGYFDGGFTGGVDPKEVRGYLPDGSPYHGGEFFVNRHGTANPVLAPMWNVVDEAQKHGTAGSLTKADMAKALNIPMGGYMQGGFTNAPATINPGVPDNRYDESYDRFVNVMERLEERLDKQIVAKVSITGDDGLERTQKLYDTMNKNGSRSKL